jgi:hypothetical protein
MPKLETYYPIIIISHRRRTNQPRKMQKGKRKSPLPEMCRGTDRKHMGRFGGTAVPPTTIRRAGFAGPRSDFCEGELARREQRIASLRFLRSKNPAGFLAKTENLLLGLVKDRRFG